MCIAGAAPAGAINWLEPPASDIGAALSFYERALETFLAGAGPTGAGSREGGATGYRAVPDIAAAMTRCTQAGGRALTEIIDLPAGLGRIAHMLEADGGRIGLHQPGRMNIAERRHRAHAPDAMTHPDARTGFAAELRGARGERADANAAC